jgi:putative phosphoesterase
MSDLSVIGLISDTHGLLRREALAALKGSDLIIHAGDVGEATIIDELRTVAPVIAVRGNIDKGLLAAQLPETAVVEARRARIYILHDVQELAIDPAAAGFQIIISGHSHKPSRSERSGVTYVNPGSAGPRRFQLPITVARLNLGQSPWTVDFIDLMARG